jgi:hypothetical protein
MLIDDGGQGPRRFASIACQALSHWVFHMAHEYFRAIFLVTLGKVMPVEVRLLADHGLANGLLHDLHP